LGFLIITLYGLLLHYSYILKTNNHTKWKCEELHN